MFYTLEQGPTEAFIIKQCVQGGIPLPNKILNAPELFKGLEFYYTAFMDLTTCRIDCGAISWFDIYNYGTIYNLDSEGMEDLLYHIQQMDAQYLKFQEAKFKQNVEKPKA